MAPDFTVLIDVQIQKENSYCCRMLVVTAVAGYWESSSFSAFTYDMLEDDSHISTFALAAV